MSPSSTNQKLSSDFNGDEYVKYILSIPGSINALIAIKYTIENTRPNSLVFIIISIISWIFYLKKNPKFLTAGVNDIKKNFFCKITLRKTGLITLSLLFFYGIFSFSNQEWKCNALCFHSIYIRNTFHALTIPLAGYFFFHTFIKKEIFYPD